MLYRDYFITFYEILILWCLQCEPEGSQHFSGANCFSAACPNRNVKGPERHKPPFVDMQVPTLVADSWRSSLHWPPPRTLTPPDWSIDCRRFFCIITFFFVAERREIGKWWHVLICGKAVKQPFPLTNSEFHLSRLTNGNNLPADNNSVMEWTSLLTMWPKYSVLGGWGYQF